MFNTAYEVGGPACAVKTVESMSGIRMDHYLEVDFTGFKKLIDDARRRRDHHHARRSTTPTATCDLQPGTHTLDGEQALGLVRTRHGVGDGSDLGRIQLQQAFIKALIEPGQERRRVHQPEEALRPRRHRHQGHHHRLRPRLGQRADAASPSGLKGIGSENIAHGHAAGARTTRPTRTASCRWRSKAEQVWDALRAGQADPEVRDQGLGRRPGRRGQVRQVAGRAAVPASGGRRNRPGIDRGPTPVLGDTASPGRLVPSAPVHVTQPAARPGALPNLGESLEARHPPRVRRDPGQLHLWRVVHHP